ncbi:MAG: 5-methyltetrahydrofolate--homocysteine methyltransferase [Bacteroidaceae bacterium]|nr:5-methyltetrahydrofolate--homocysteine methyltransferase [Bacteroidaceae bacterium]
MTHTQRYTIHEAAGYINWLYFFHAWGFPSRYSSIASVHGCVACRQNWLQAFPEEERDRARQAMRLYDEAQQILRQWDEAGYHTLFSVRLMEANSDGEDIVLTASGQRIPFLRQQHPQEGKPCLCLADFVRPLMSGIPDRIGIFASTIPSQVPTDKLEEALIADRLAEATAELGHLQTRRQWWGYAPDEHLTLEELFAEKYQGKRPAVGYPSLPDQSVCFLLSDLLDFPSLGIRLTENGAMIPHASTCGFMFAHPATCHFSVGKVGEDQLRDYARRRGISAESLHKFFR